MQYSMREMQPCIWNYGGLDGSLDLLYDLVELIKLAFGNLILQL